MGGVCTAPAHSGLLLKTLLCHVQQGCPLASRCLASSTPHLSEHSWVGQLGPKERDIIPGGDGDLPERQRHLAQASSPSASPPAQGGGHVEPSALACSNGRASPRQERTESPAAPGRTPPHTPCRGYDPCRGSLPAPPRRHARSWKQSCLGQRACSHPGRRWPQCRCRCAVSVAAEWGGGSEEGREREREAVTPMVGLAMPKVGG